jgi:formylglycine-generating enzyme required for sulfatase activity
MAFLRQVPLCVCVFGMTVSCGNRSVPPPSPTHPAPRSVVAKPSCAAGMVYVAGGALKRRPGDYTALAGVRSVAPLCVGITEVTVGEYARCVDDGVCSKPACDGRPFDEARVDYPVTCVNWTAAALFCDWSAHRRLPTAVEFEWVRQRGPAACGCIDRLASCNAGGSGDKTTEGVCDLNGNVAEWTVTSVSSLPAHHWAAGNDFVHPCFFGQRFTPVRDEARWFNVGFRCVKDAE